MGPFEITRDNERLLALLKKLGRVPSDLNHLSGVIMSETVDEENVAGLSLILGTPQGIDGRRPKAIPIATDKDRPHDKNGRIYRADVMPDGDTFKLVRPRKSGVALRFITTGLLVAPDGTTSRDFRSLVGKKLQYHGVFPLSADACEIVGEDIDFSVSGESKVIIDERLGSIKGLPGIPRSREIGIEGVVGGPIIVGQIDGTLKIHELTTTGWKTHDVTDNPKWQKQFLDFASKDARYLADVAEAEKRQQRNRKRVRVTRGPPSDHPDA
ncbi:MAG TPA: hypothetical protein VMU27_01215 [Candidatus Paceibacterota bacterium]|nr:hypothetical protein [Candidatus Paceibacterota bacterium]